MRGETLSLKKWSVQMKDKEYCKIFNLAITFIPPAFLVLCRPLHMNLNQSLVTGGLLLVLIWWSTGLVNKIVSSCVLLAIFLIFGKAPVATVFSFPLSDTFLLIILCYLFSRGIENAHIAEKTMSPFLFRYVNTSLKMVFTIIAFFVLTMYVIPQPLARLIIIANIISTHLKKTNAKKDVQEVLMFGVFVFYVIVNMSSMDADIILNTSSVGFAGLDLTSGDWSRYMTLPTIGYAVAVVGLFSIVFRKQMIGVTFEPGAPVIREPFTKQEKRVLAVVGGTVFLWMTSSWHGVNPTLITLAGTVLLFAFGVLKVKDFSAIDITTLVFLTAAFCIGGVMKYTGIADIIFSEAGRLFPNQAGTWYILVMVFITMAMHLVLGSNTTTLSVILPGLITICNNAVSETQILFIAYISLTAHFLLPFHAVAIMIGVSNHYFPAKYVAKFGLPMMVLIVVGILGIYVPYWSLMGLT